MTEDAQSSPQSDTKPRGKAFWIFAGALAIVCCLVLSYAWLDRLPYLESDEGFYLRLGQERIWELPHPLSLSSVTSVSSQFPTTPLYAIVVSWWLRSVGPSLHLARIFPASIAMLIVFAVGYFAFRIQGVRAAVFAVFGMVSIPWFWMYGREMIPHGLTILLIVISFIGAYRFRCTRSFFALSVCIAAGSVAPFISYWALWYCALLPFLFAPWKRKISLLTFLPLIAILAYWAERWITYGALFSKDAQMFFLWQSGGGTLQHANLLTQGLHSIVQLIIASSMSPALLCGVVGLFFLRDRWLRTSLLLMYVIGGLFVFRDRYVQLSPYLLVMTTPIAIIGFGIFADRMCEKLEKWKGARSVQLFSLAICSILVAFSGVIVARMVRGELAHTIGKARLESIYSVSDYVNARIQKNSYVIAPAEVYWRINARSVDETWVYARVRGTINELFSGVYRTQDSYFSYPTDSRFASYVVQRIGAEQVVLPDRQTVVSLGAWPLVYHDTYFKIFQNPNISAL